MAKAIPLRRPLLGAEAAIGMATRKPSALIRRHKTTKGCTTRTNNRVLEGG